MNIQAGEQFERRKEIVNRAVKICIECGSVAVLIDNYGIYCNNCNSRFKIKEEKISA
ncbi:MAG: hypothetical protein ACR2LL_04605 [Nitrosopumilus sp.]|uniref:hypothetical protein n=1 Tax=Nitrosopumilus sp. TaxID=2024843 RepID=UPI00292E45F8|nr:hypothetical protein [Nitrosopumilus sp.]